MTLLSPLPYGFRPAVSFMLSFLDLFLQSEADVISRPDEQPEKT
jgi:hypothetical protein